ncbi:MAG: hypothetical protein KA024_01590 [Zoogloea sp.]|nr:hypothetical protein [Zoogloea sp.]
MVKPIEIRPAQNLMILACLGCNLKRPDRQPNSQFGFFGGATASCLCQQATSRPKRTVGRLVIDGGFTQNSGRARQGTLLVELGQHQGDMMMYQ